MKNPSKLILAALLSGSVAQAANTIFEANFESGLAANTGTITYNAGYNVQVAVTGGPDATLGSNVLFADPTTGSAAATDITLTPTVGASLTGGQTAVVSFDFAIRRTYGDNKSHYVTGYDSSNTIIFQFVLGELNEFGNGATDRQRPGYATNAGAFSFAGEIVSGATPGSYWFGNDAEGDGFNSSKDAHFDLTIGASGWSVYTTKLDGTEAQTGSLATYDGGTFTDLAYVTVTGESSSAGGFFDNLTIVAVPEPSSAALLGLGGLALLRRRRK